MISGQPQDVDRRTWMAAGKEPARVEEAVGHAKVPGVVDIVWRRAAITGRKTIIRSVRHDR